VALPNWLEWISLSPPNHLQGATCSLSFSFFSFFLSLSSGPQAHLYLFLFFLFPLPLSADRFFLSSLSLFFSSYFFFLYFSMFSRYSSSPFPPSHTRLSLFFLLPLFVLFSLTHTRSTRERDELRLRVSARENLSCWGFEFQFTQVRFFFLLVFDFYLFIL
jgi:hypothetical protein